jgi:hypothetical protein
MNGAPIWQRNYHDRIIRNDHEMGEIWQYIESKIRSTGQMTPKTLRSAGCSICCTIGQTALLA